MFYPFVEEASIFVEKSGQGAERNKRLMRVE
jgi:hypothetical protein